MYQDRTCTKMYGSARTQKDVEHQRTSPTQHVQHVRPARCTSPLEQQDEDDARLSPTAGKNTSKTQDEDAPSLPSLIDWRMYMPTPIPIFWIRSHTEKDKNIINTKDTRTKRKRTSLYKKHYVQRCTGEKDKSVVDPTSPSGVSSTRHQVDWPNNRRHPDARKI